MAGQKYVFLNILGAWMPTDFRDRERLLQLSGSPSQNNQVDTCLTQYLFGPSHHANQSSSCWEM